MYSQNIVDALDETIATVAEQEFNRLHGGLNDIQVAEQVAKALDSLDELQGVGQPDYNDEWVALLYVTWYQPRQINVALTLLLQLYEETLYREAETGYPVDIIDFGCGALAVQFATAIAATECRHTAVAVKGVDPSNPMKRIGEKLWSEFCSIIVKQPDLSDLSQTCNLMTGGCEVFDSFDSYLCTDPPWGYYPGSNCLLLAVHAVYDSNLQKITETLQKFRDIAHVFPMFVTCHKNKSNIARSAIGKYDSRQEIKREELSLKGNLPKTTEWRRGLIKSLSERSLASRDRIYLENEVEWDPSYHHTLVYGKESKS